MSQRVAKVESVIRHIVAPALVQLLGPESANVTVTAVEASPDLRQATVWLGLLGDDFSIMQQVADARSDLQRRLAAAMTTKFVPRLTFRADQSGRYAQEINELLGSL